MTIQTAMSDPVTALSVIGVLGVGAQWIAWRIQIPAIVLMLAAGVLMGPVLGILNPVAQLGSITQPMVSIAVAIILFEGGLTLNRDSLSGAGKGVLRLVVLGAPLGWAASAAVLHYVAGLGWQSASVFGGIMIVTGPTVIAPLLRQAKLAKRPAALLQWEAIVNDPIGALAAVLAFEYVLVLHLETSFGHAMQALAIGVIAALVLGGLAGYGIAQSFRRGWVPEYMKIPVLFVVLVGVFAASNRVLHESGLLAVTVMGIWIANSDLPSYQELRRFKEHATVLLVSGVFILLAASLDLDSLALLDWRAVAFVGVVVFVARPLTVLLALLGTSIPWRERWLVALIGPRGVVLVAVAGLFGTRLQQLGVTDAHLIAPLAFALVSVSVVLHGFTLRPLAKVLDLADASKPGVLMVGATTWATELAIALQNAKIPVLLTDPNMRNLRAAKDAGIPTYFGDILSEGAENHLDWHSFQYVIAASDNDAYNTLVTTDLGPEFGRSNVFQTAREQDNRARHALPSTLGGRSFAAGLSYSELVDKIRSGWGFGVTTLTETYGLAEWRNDRPDAIVIAILSPKGNLRIVQSVENLKPADGSKIIHFRKPRQKTEENIG